MFVHLRSRDGIGSEPDARSLGKYYRESNPVIFRTVIHDKDYRFVPQMSSAQAFPEGAWTLCSLCYLQCLWSSQSHWLLLEPTSLMQYLEHYGPLDRLVNNFVFLCDSLCTPCCLYCHFFQVLHCSVFRRLQAGSNGIHDEIYEAETLGFICTNVLTSQTHIQGIWKTNLCTKSYIKQTYDCREFLAAPVDMVVMKMMNVLFLTDSLTWYETRFAR